MTADNFAEWLRRQGHHVVRSASSYWYNQGPRVYQAFPYHQLIAPDEDELRALLVRERMLGARFSTDLDAHLGAVSYHVVCRSTLGRLENIPRKARHDIRRGLNAGRVQQIPLSRLADEGWELRKDTLERQGRTRAESQQWWSRLCRAADGIPGFEAWGLLADETMAASLLAFRCDDCVSILYQQSRTSHLAAGVNNALAFDFARAALSRAGVSSLFYGLASLDAPASVDEFKFRMGFTPQPVRQRVVLHPALRPFVGRPLKVLVARTSATFPGLPIVRKGSGLLSLYLEGLKPLGRQDSPACVKSQVDSGQQ